MPCNMMMTSASSERSTSYGDGNSCAPTLVSFKVNDRTTTLPLPLQMKDDIGSVNVRPDLVLTVKAVVKPVGLSCHDQSVTK